MACGFSETESNFYRIWNPKTRRVVESRNIVYIETPPNFLPAARRLSPQQDLESPSYGFSENTHDDQILSHARGQGNVHFPCSADHEQDWQPYPVDPYSAICDDHTYIHTYIHDDNYVSHDDMLWDVQHYTSTLDFGVDTLARTVELLLPQQASPGVTSPRGTSPATISPGGVTPEESSLPPA